MSEGDKKKTDEAASSDRFVLTPAFRVFDGVPAASPRDTGTPAREASGDLFRHAPMDLTQVSGPGGGAGAGADDARPVAAEGAAPFAPATDPATDAADAPQEALPNPDFLAMERAWQQELERMSARRAASGPGEGSQETGGSAAPRAPQGVSGSASGGPDPSPAPVTSLEARIAELEEAVNRAGDDWEPDGTEPDIDRPPSLRIFEVVENTHAKALAGDETFLGAGAQGTGAQGTGAQGAGDPPDAGADDEAGRVPVAPVFSHSDDKPYVLSGPSMLPRPLDPPPAPASGPRLAVPDEAGDAAPDGPEAPDTVPALGQAGGEVVEDDDVYLDVDALREMITEVVRDELRGRLGETITRNVRKMVRQEIARAISRDIPD